MKEVMDLIEACSVLHNILLKDDNIPQEWITTLEEQTDSEVYDSYDSAAEPDASRRHAIFHYTIETFYST